MKQSSTHTRQKKASVKPVKTGTDSKLTRARKTASKRTNSSTADDDLRETTSERIKEAIRRMVASASQEVMHEVLRQSTDVGSIIHLLSSVGVGDAAAIDPFAAARLRGVEVKQRLIQAAGGTYGTGEVASILGISEQGVHARLARGKLLAVSFGNDRNWFPTCQFTNNGVVEGIDTFLGTCNVEDPWTRLALLLDAQPGLGGSSILDALKSGRRDAALRITSSFGS